MMVTSLKLSALELPSKIKTPLDFVQPASIGFLLCIYSTRGREEPLCSRFLCGTKTDLELC